MRLPSIFYADDPLRANPTHTVAYTAVSTTRPGGADSSVDISNAVEGLAERDAQ